jgi:hypothetical protein
MTEECITPLRRRMIEDMSVRHFASKTQHDYIRTVIKLTRTRGFLLWRFSNAGPVSADSNGQ